MSFLLDALRKSEFERRIGEIPELTSELPPQSTRPKRHPFIVLIIVLALINIGTLLYITVLDRVDPEIAKENPSRSELSRITSAPIEKTGPDGASDNPAKTEIPAVPRPHTKPMVSVTSPSPEKLADISPAAQIRTDRQPAGLTPRPTSPPKQNPQSVEQKPPVEKLARDLASKPAQGPIDTKPPMNSEKPKSRVKDKLNVEKPFTVAMLPPSATPPKPASDGIPLLSAMPRDFQREVPSLNINVFVYSDIPEERFVIVNMDKYQTGEKVGNGPEIVEIRSDSLVLDYLGKKFRVKRP